MIRVAFILSFSLLAHSLKGQQLDSLKLYARDIPKEYFITNDVKCISPKACAFYQDTDNYSSLVGDVKKKSIQYFKNEEDSGAIIYLEFTDEFTGQAFLENMLWGEEMRPTKDHPEEYQVINDTILIIWSLKKNSRIKLLSKNKLKGRLR